MISLYTNLLHSHPFITKSVTNGLIFSFSDFLTQKFIQKKQEFQWNRNLALGLTGLTLYGPLMHIWYARVSPKFLTRFVSETRSHATRAAIGMVFNQAIFSPTMLIGFYMMYSVYHEFSVGRGVTKGLNDIKSKMVPTLKNNWKVWPLAIYVNLLFVPFHYQVLFANVVSVFWNIYLSWMVSHSL